MRHLFFHSILLGTALSLLLCPLSGAFAQDTGKFPAWQPYTGPAAGHSYFGYSWPFEGRDLDSEIGDSPVLIELFTDQGCMFCPPADQFLNDLVRKTRVIALSCHINVLGIVPDAPYASQACAERQIFYSAMLREPRNTPQMFINGHIARKGFLFKEIADQMIRSKDNPLIRLRIEDTSKPHHYQIHLPQMEFGPLEDFSDRAYVKLIEYRKPVRSKISTGPNEGAEIDYLHVVKDISPLADWFGQEQIYEFDWTPSSDAAGAVILFERKDTGALAVGEIRRD